MSPLELLNAEAALPVNGKSETAYKTISEVSDELGVPQHVLRFWESHFAQVKPSRVRGRRYYRPQDVDLLKKIKTLLYQEGFTIKGAKKMMKEKESPLAAQAAVMAPQPAILAPKEPKKAKATQDVQFLTSELRVLKSMLTALL